MKKIIIACFIFILSISQQAMAKNVKVEAVSSFSTANPPQTWSLRIQESFVTKKGFAVHAGSIVSGEIKDVTDPKRLKRNASFVFLPTKYYDIKTGCSYQIENSFTGKYSNMTDVTPKSVAKQGAIFVGNQVLDGFFGPGIAVAEGLIKNEENNRAKSVVVKVYESTPLSYCNKGKELEIAQGQQFIMSFKALEVENNEPNYSYTIQD